MHVLAVGSVLLSVACSSPSPKETQSPEPLQPSIALLTDASPSPILLDAGVGREVDGGGCRQVTLEVGASPLGYRAMGDLCDGLRQGPWKFVFLDGQRHREGAFTAGLETGPWFFWYHSGKKRSEGSFKRGQRTGVWIRNHENGVRSLEGRYKDGLRDGRWRRWHANGTLYEDRQYEEGKRQGLHRKWNDAGDLRYVRNCLNDRCRVECRAKGKKNCPPAK